MILVDTSAWVEYDRATGSSLDRRLTELIASGGAKVAVTEPVLPCLLTELRSRRPLKEGVHRTCVASSDARP